jgi:hypothetical protein
MYLGLLDPDPFVRDPAPDPDPLVIGLELGSSDRDPVRDPYQNVMDPQHFGYMFSFYRVRFASVKSYHVKLKFS